jgi:S-adenosylhomocysteine hydrolase
MFPTLPVLEELYHRCPSQSQSVLAQTVFVCVQHLLSTTGSLFQSLIKLGAKPSNIFILGKCYSTNSDVLQEMRSLGINVSGGETPLRYGTFVLTIEEEVRKLWNEVYRLKKNSASKKMIIIDDGGKCLNSLPYKFRDDKWQVVGIEQTTSGLNPLGLFDHLLIEVASSAAKRQVESPIVAEAISKRICHAAASINATSYGIVGYGNIGKAVSTALYQQGYKVSVFDKSDEPTSNAPNHIFREESIRSLIDNAQFVLGCTGKDILPDPNDTLRNMSGQKIFASCSSGDYEFEQLLLDEQLFIDSRTDICDKIAHTLQDTELYYSRRDRSPRIKILRGGFPVNFDGSPESAPSVDIQLTRGLLLGAVIQATLYFEDLDSHTIPNQNNHKMLDPYIQRMVVDVWQQQASDKLDLVENFQDIEWIRNNSGGKRSDSETLKSSYALQWGKRRIRTK